MKNNKHLFFLALLSLATFLWTACGSEHKPGDGHDHGTEAPAAEGEHAEEAGVHGGHILEIDDAHAHHAELVFDNSTRDVTLYFYGGVVGVAKVATELEFEIEKDGKEVALESKASPLDGETESSCSRFIIAGSQRADKAAAYNACGD